MENNLGRRRSTHYLAVTACFRYLNVKTTSPVPNGGDVNVENDQTFPHDRSWIISLSIIKPLINLNY